METNKSDKALNVSIAVSFGIMGITALTFQVVFGKKLMLLFGMTAPAVGTVLAVYFSGMALGSYLLGKAADRFTPKTIYKFYIWFFVLTGVYGLLFPVLFKLLNTLILLVDRSSPLDFSGFNFFAFIFSFIFLILPAVFLGGGLAVTSKIFIHKEGRVAKNLSLLYFANTFGGMTGALLTGFLFIPYYGLSLTLSFASWLSIVTAAGLYLLFKRRGTFSLESPSAGKEFKEPEGMETTIIKNRVFMYALFITGFLALALEVFYTKTLILFIGSSTYAFSMILVVFLMGIALGSLAASPILSRFKVNYAFFGMLLGALGFWLFISISKFEQTPFWYLRVFRLFGSYDFQTVTFAQFIVTCFFVFPPAFLMGIILPLGIKLATPGLLRLGEGVGTLYFSNTLGGVLGSLVAGFVFMQKFGYQNTLIIIAISYFALGGFFIVKEKSLPTLVKIVFMTLPVSFAVSSIFTHSWSHGIVSSGLFQRTTERLNFPEEVLKQSAIDREILFYSEGLSNIAVSKLEDVLLLRINGKTDASTFPSDLEAEILIGAIPMTLHPDPEEVLVVGLGAGVSLGSITQFDEAKNIDMVEIDPAIFKAAEYFNEYNNSALHDTRVNAILADARNHLYLTEKKYDVVSLEPSNIWVSGNVNLFTKEFYELVRSRLNDDGIILQWIHAYSLELEDIKSIIKTFSKTFPQTLVFDGVNIGDMFLVGSTKKESILDFDVINKKFKNKKVRDEFARIYVKNPYELLSYIVIDSERAKEFSVDAPVHTDDRTFIEFSASRAAYKNTSADILKNIYFMQQKSNPLESVLSGDKKELERYFEFAKRLMLYKISFAKADYPGAVDMYIDAKNLGITSEFAEMNLLRECESGIEKAMRENNQVKAKAIYDKCNELFGN